MQVEGIIKVLSSRKLVLCKSPFFVTHVYPSDISTKIKMKPPLIIFILGLPSNCTKRCHCTVFFIYHSFFVTIFTQTWFFLMSL